MSMRQRSIELADRAEYGHAAQAYALLAVAEAITGLTRAIEKSKDKPIPVGLTITTEGKN